MREFHCQNCDFSELLTDETAVTWLRRSGSLRRVVKPRMDLVYELLESGVNQFPCPNCEAQQIRLREREEFGEEWPETRLCEVCKATIPPERLELFPDSKRCAKCQNQGDVGEVEYCPRCGGIMKVMQKGRTSTYLLTCTECRHVQR